MLVVTNSMVKYHYKLIDLNNDQLLESSYDDIEEQYIHGVSEVLPGLSQALEGKSAGDQFEVTLDSGQAYGDYDADKTGRVALKHLTLPGNQPIRGKLQAGTAVEIQTEQGLFEGSIIKQGLKNADVDINHPYAGKSLKYIVEIIAVRPATASELAGENSGGGCSCC